MNETSYKSIRSLLKESARYGKNVYWKIGNDDPVRIVDVMNRNGQTLVKFLFDGQFYPVKKTDRVYTN